MALGPVIQGLVALSTVIAKNFARIKKMKDTKERAELVKKTDKDLQTTMAAESSRSGETQM